MVKKTKDMFTVQNLEVFFNDLLSVSSKAGPGDIIWVQSMLFETGKPDGYIQSFVDYLCKAKTNGAEVYVLIDSFGILTAKEIPIKSFLNASKITPAIKELEREKQILRNKLQKAGIELRIGSGMGQLKAAIPWAFCNHRKSYGILNTKKNIYTAWVTSFNLSNLSFNQYEIALKITDKKLVEIIYSQFQADYNKKDLWRNKIYKINEYVSYLIENNTNNSVIKKTAYQLINDAKEYIRFTSQYPVDPFLLKKFIARAKQGVRIEILTSKKEDEYNYRKPFNYIDKNFNKKLSQYPNITRGYFPGKVHAKLLFSEKEALIGSDNIIVIGKFLQTKENMLHISNERLISQVNTIFEYPWRKSEKYP